MENDSEEIKINIPNKETVNLNCQNEILTNISNDNLYTIDTKIKTSKDDNENREKFYKKTPNTKIQIITKEIYLNRKNVIKNSEKSTNKYKINFKSLPINTSFELNNISHFKNERTLSSDKIHSRLTDKSIENSLNTNSFSSLNKINNLYPYHYKENFSNLYTSKTQNDNISIRNDDSKHKNINKIDENEENIDRISPIVSTGHIDVSSESNNCDVENTSPELTDSTTDSTTQLEHHVKHDFRDKHFKDPKKRHHRRFNKLKKKNFNEIDGNSNCVNDSDYNDDLSQSDCSPRIDTSLWNDDVENYYIEFQKICIDESIKYKQLNYRHEFISNLLKFILLISSCFTFTLSLSSPSSVFFQVSTTITSILTTIITSIISFFTFEKRSEIEYYIYKGLDKINQNISIELIKPPQIRCDPYELILTLQNQRDELLKKIHKKI